MSWIKRMAQKIDDVIAGLENTEAVKHARLQRVRQQAETAEQHLNQLRQRLQKIDSLLSERDEKVQEWQTRAVESAQTDEATALNCLRFANRLEREAKHLRRTALDLQKQVAKIEPFIEEAWARYHTATTDYTVRTQFEASLTPFDRAIEDDPFTSTSNDIESLRAQLAELATTHKKGEQP